MQKVEVKEKPSSWWNCFAGGQSKQVPQMPKQITQQPAPITPQQIAQAPIIVSPIISPQKSPTYRIDSQIPLVETKQQIISQQIPQIPQFLQPSQQQQLPFPVSIPPTNAPIAIQPIPQPFYGQPSEQAQQKIEGAQQIPSIYPRQIFPIPIIPQMVPQSQQQSIILLPQQQTVWPMSMQPLFYSVPPTFPLLQQMPAKEIQQQLSKEQQEQGEKEKNLKQSPAKEEGEEGKQIEMQKQPIQEIPLMQPQVYSYPTQPFIPPYSPLFQPQMIPVLSPFLYGPIIHPPNILPQMPLQQEQQEDIQKEDIEKKSSSKEDVQQQ